MTGERERTAPKETALPEGKPRAKVLAWFVLIVFFSLVVHLAYLSQLKDNPLFEHPIMDAKVHHEWAERFAAGQEWSVDQRTQEAIPYFRAPLYIWFLGTIYKVFGVDPGLPPRLIQSLLGALSCGLIYLLARRLFGKAAGILAGFAAALYWTLVYFDNELLIVPLIVFLDLACLNLLVSAHDRGKWFLWSAAGLAMGLSAIARPNILLFAPFVCLWILFVQARAGRMLRGGIPKCLAFGIALLVPIVPITIRNYVEGHDTVLIASQGGVNFYIGNNPETDGVTAVVPGTPNDWWGGYYATQDMARRALGHEPKASEVSGYFFGKALDFWRTEPLKALYALVAKARYFLSQQEFANNKCIYTFTEDFTPFTRWLFVGFWIAAPLGLLGFFLSLRRGAARLFPLWGFGAAYSLSVILFFITARFRMPVVPVFIIYGAFALVWFFEKARERAYVKLGAAAASLAVLFPFVLYVPGPGTFHPYKGSEEFYCILGNELVQRDDIKGALHYLDLAAEKARRNIEKRSLSHKQQDIDHRVLSTALFTKGNILEEQNRLPEALKAYIEALPHVPALLPEKARLHQRIAAILDALGDHRKAALHRIEAQKIRDALMGRPAGGGKKP